MTLPKQEQDNLDQSIQLQKRSHRINLIIILVFVAGFLIFQLVSRRAAAGSGFVFSENALIINQRDGESIQVPYTDIQEVAFFEEADYGEPVTGQVTGFLSFKQMEGVFRSNTFGEYTACASPRITSAILIKTETASFVLNKESNETTQTLYGAILQLLEEIG